MIIIQSLDQESFQRKQWLPPTSNRIFPLVKNCWHLLSSFSFTSSHLLLHLTHGDVELFHPAPCNFRKLTRIQKNWDLFAMILDDRCMLNLFEQLQATELDICAQICKKWHRLANLKNLWRQKMTHDFKNEMEPNKSGSKRRKFRILTWKERYVAQILQNKTG